MNMSLLKGLILVLICLAITMPLKADKAGNWKPLSNGKDFQGWHPVGDGKWTVEDGAFVGRANKEKLYGLLVSDKTFKDFSVKCKFKCLSGEGVRPGLHEVPGFWYTLLPSTQI